MKSDLILQLRVWQQQPSKLVLAACHSDSQQLNPATQSLVLSALANPICAILPPNRQFTKRLIKQLIQLLEDDGEGLSEEVLQLYTLLLAPVDPEFAEQAQDDSSWRDKTFYYSSSPSTLQLQQLQQQHVANCIKACSQLQQAGQHLESIPAAGLAAAVPLLQLRQLQARQRLMAELLAAAGLQQEKVTNLATQPCCYVQCGSSIDLDCGCRQCAKGRGLGNNNNIRNSDRVVQQQHAAQQQQHELQQEAVPQPEQHDAQPPQQQQALQQQQQQHDAQPPQQQQALQQQQQHAVQQQPPVLHSAGLLSVHMSDNLFEGGTGCHMWDAGFLLAEFVLNHQHLLTGKSCLEIGCGPGLVATCLARLKPVQLLLTDGDPQTLVNCVSNMALNGHAVKLLGGWQEAVNLTAVHSMNFTAAQGVDFTAGAVAVKQQRQQGEQQATSRSVAAAKMKHFRTSMQVLACPLDWHADVPGLWADVIVGSDILYDPAAVPSVVRLLSQLLGAPGAPACSSNDPHTNLHLESAKHAEATHGDVCSIVEHTSFEDGTIHRHGGANSTHITCCDCENITTVVTSASDYETYILSRRRASVAYLSTTRRQPSTLQMFEDLATEAGLLVEELSMQPSNWCEQPVVFCELPALQDRDKKFVLHRVTAL